MTLVSSSPSGPAQGLWRTRTFRELNQRIDELLGDAAAKDLAALRIGTVGDLLRHVPRRYLAGTEVTDLHSVTPGDDVAVVARVRRIERRQSRPAPGKRAPRDRLEVEITDGRGAMQLTFFGKDHLLKWWSGQLSLGVKGIFVGKVGVFRGALQMTHPDFVMLDGGGHIVGSQDDKRQAMLKVSQSGLVGIYPQTRKLPTWMLADTIQKVLETIGPLDEPWPSWVLDEAEVMPLWTALHEVHVPNTVELAAMGRERLIFDEALSMQLAMAYRRADARLHAATPRRRVAGGLLDAFDERLPFVLTQGQLDVGETIFTELAREHPMQRLLQGEVGSGKTIVALRAMLTVIDNGGQAALLAPTEVLAAQHYQTIQALLGDLGHGRTLGAPDVATEVALLSGSLPAAQKKATLLKAASGEAGIIVGTHALLSERVQFADLGLVVVDEQHRFGVEQRAALTAKADTRPHVLVMTATPIPRSVAMTVFGDLETSTLREIPAGRQDVATVLVDAVAHPAWVDRAWQRIREEVAQGRQAFVVCPRISVKDGDKTDESATVDDTYAMLTAGPLADVRVGLLHGALPADEKDATMRAFAAGDLDVLVATTVVEVGVDVPNASVMVILDADRFGISQLHQLRGRIGRGEHPGVCLLITSVERTSDAAVRLAAVAATRDGFELAELDLAQRREGDVLGADQSGRRSSLRLLRVLEHAEVIELTRDIAERLAAADPDRTHPGVSDAVTQTELLAAGEWLERS